MKSIIKKINDFLGKPGRTGIISVLMPVLFMCFLITMPGVYFETNDDKTIMEILSGVLTIQPDPHVIYVNYLLALPLSLLYGINRTIPWYGIMMLSFHGISYLAISRAIYRRCKSRAQILAGTAFQIIFLCLQVYSFLQIQYTSTAALLAVAGYVVLTLRKSDVKGRVLFWILEGFAMLLRVDAFLMIQPFGICLWLGTQLLEENLRFKRPGGRKENSDKGKRILITAAILCVLWGISEAGNAYGYGKTEWKTFNRYNRARTTLVDYTGVPAYEEVKEILEKYEVTQTTYEAMSVLTTGDIPVECMEEVAAYAKENAPRKNLLELPGDLIRFALQNGDWGVARSLTVIMGVTMLWILYTKKKQLFVAWLGIMASHVAVFGYLIYRGRMPYRVTFPLQAGEALMLMTLMILAMKEKRGRGSERRLRNPNTLVITETVLQGQEENSTASVVASASENVAASVVANVAASVTNPQPPKPAKSTRSQVIRLALGIMALIVLGIPAGIAGIRLYRYSAKVNSNQSAYLKGTYEVLEYCNAHSDQKYLIEEEILMYATGHLLETRLLRPRNAMISHCWYSVTPTMMAKWDDYFGGLLEDWLSETNTDPATLKIIVREAEDYSENLLLKRAMELTGKEPVVEEILEVSHGGRYAVIRFE